MELGNGTFLNGDCLELMRGLPSGSVDMVLCDLPYGTTACSWDSVIPFESLWEQYWRVCKPNAAIVLTASQPFTTALIGFQIDRFKYTWVWVKDKPSNFALANRQPLKYHEDVCVFYAKQPTYNKIMEPRKGSGKSRVKYVVDNSNRQSDHHDIQDAPKFYGELRNPSSVQEVSTGRRQDITHPTQKPVALFEYLIRTYTNPGELVLDNTAGSGTTAIAAENAGSKWICMERDPTYYETAVGRVYDHLTR